MSIRSVVTRGYGPGGSIKQIVARGYLGLPIVRSLVCAAINLYAALAGESPLSMATIGTPRLRTAIDGDLEIGTAVNGTPDLRKC